MLAYANENLFSTVANVPIVEASRFECDIMYRKATSCEGHQIAIADKVLGISRVEAFLREDYILYRLSLSLSGSS